MTVSPKATQISVIDVTLVDVAARRRKLDPAWVEAISDMFSWQGQKTPIEVIANGERYRLVFGGHRLAAAKLLGWASIDAVIKNPEDFANEAEVKLAEITENLGRRELNALDRAVDIADWREIYEAARGSVKRGRPSKLSQVATISEDGAELFASSFSEAARKALGVTRDTISRAMRIASIAAEVRDLIALHAIADNQSELLALAAEPAARQADIAALLTSESAQADSVADAIAILDRLPKPNKAPGWQKLADGFARLKPNDQRRFFQMHEAAILSWLKEREG